MQGVRADRDDTEDEELASKDEPLAPALRKRGAGRHKASQGPDDMTEKRAFLLWRRNNPAASIHQLSLLSFPQSTLRAADGSLRFGQPVPKGCSAEHGERARSMSAAPAVTTGS